MGRWGEEEKKSRGIFGCLITVTLFGLSIWGFVQVYPILEAHREFESTIEQIARTAHTKSEDKIRGEIISEMRRLEIPAEPEDLFVEKKRKDYNGSLTMMVTVRLDYAATADFVVFKYSIPKSINEVVPLIEF
ncbi:MAG: hypothetical protein KDC35_15370 [Acidobacteria bacterium]|nr:hypothetical protein [Acidobacteriota bacterium]